MSLTQLTQTNNHTGASNPATLVTNKLAATVGHVGTSGATFMKFSVEGRSSNIVAGDASISHAIGAPHGDIAIEYITGTIDKSGATKTIALTGTYGTPHENFSAHMRLNDNGTGTGSFTYGRHQVNNVPVIQTEY